MKFCTGLRRADVNATGPVCTALRAREPPCVSAAAGPARAVQAEALANRAGQALPAWRSFRLNHLETDSDWQDHVGRFRAGQVSSVASTDWSPARRFGSKAIKRAQPKM